MKKNIIDKYKKEELQYFIFNKKLSYEKIGKIYNVSGSAIRKIACKLGIELPKRRIINEKETFNKGKIISKKVTICKNCGKNFLAYASSKNKYCSIQCQKEYRHKLLYEKCKNGDASIMRANYSPKIFKQDILKEQNNKCAICGMSPIWNNKELVFIIDHIDGNASNNKRDNLRCICPNCDSQLDTYKSKNKKWSKKLL